MLTMQELIKIAAWFEKNFIGTYYISFLEGFKDNYIIIETEKDKSDGRQVFSIREILNQEN